MTGSGNDGGVGMAGAWKWQRLGNGGGLEMAGAWE